MNMQSPLKRLYNIEKTLFPDIEKIKNDINDFEKALIEVYSEKRKNGCDGIDMKG